MIIDALSLISLVSGSIVLLIGTIGILRMPDFYTRLHAASVIDTLGVMLIILGLLLQAGPSLIGIKLILVLVVLLVTSPVAAHALAKSALHGQLKPKLSDDCNDPVH